MKKIYLSILAGVFALTVNAQLTLTKAFNEPVIADVNTRKTFDSTSALPKSSGTNQNWNFTTLTTNTLTEMFTYTMAASTPSASTFPGSTLAEADPYGGYNYYKSTASTFEYVGFVTSASNYISFTNTAIMANWPINFGYSNTDMCSGTMSFFSLTGPIDGTVNCTAPGSGTVTIPGNVVFNNCLQFKVVNTNTGVIGAFPFSFTVNSITTEYHYYSVTQKFPIVMLSYESQTLTSSSGPTVSAAAGITINNNVLTGINDLNFESINYNVYPNPATNAVNVNLTNAKSENISVIVMNNLGQVVKSINLGNATEVKYIMSTSDLESGIYYVKISAGERSTTKKLIIQ